MYQNHRVKKKEQIVNIAQYSSYVPKPGKKWSQARSLHIFEILPYWAFLESAEASARLCNTPKLINGILRVVIWKNLVSAGMKFMEEPSKYLIFITSYGST